ncbi:MAG: AGE family epimerase/isomerase, partial [Proteobacteria bacterium]|nr:AGE family epimerase/isomerase [Pseudomonadota bacterium]
PAESAEGFRDQNIYGALFATVGLIRLALASGDSRDLPLIRKTLRKSVARYEDPAYPGVQVPGIEAAGLRAQGHSFMFVWVLGQMLELDPSPEWEALCRQHQQHLVQDFWNPEFGISNEFLSREYKPLPGYADYMVPGHSIEAQWMALQEALRQGNQQEALTLAGRIRRLYEIAWDPIFGGFSDTAYRVFPTADAPAGPVTDLKTMWAQTEVLIACMVAHQLTGESWAVDAYQRTWEFLMRTMPTGTGVWRQAVDRKGNPKEREGISPYRKGNFHQPRLLIMGLQMW